MWKSNTAIFWLRGRVGITLKFIFKCIDESKVARSYSVIRVREVMAGGIEVIWRTHDEIADLHNCRDFDMGEWGVVMLGEDSVIFAARCSS